MQSNIPTQGGDQTKRLAQYCVTFKYEDLPHKAVALAKDIVLDTLGAMLYGSSTKYSASRLTGDLAHMLGGKEECTVIGRDFKTSVVNAALVNGTIGYAADLEGAQVARQRPPAVLVPTCLAMGEREKVDGKTFLASLALGYDIAARVALAGAPKSDMYVHSFHPAATFGHFGATAAAGYMLKLNQEQFRNAFGIAGCQVSGLVTWALDPTENCRPFVIGVAVRNGVTGALLAKMGFGAPSDIFDGGRFNLYEAVSDSMRLEEVTKDLGKKYWIMEARGFKIYGCCADIHAGLDALFKIMQEKEIGPEDIAKIVYRVQPGRVNIIDNNPCRSHNAQYILGAAAVNGKLAPDEWVVDKRGDPRIAEMVKRVKLVGDPGLEMPSAPVGTTRPGALDLMTQDGRKFSHRVDKPKGYLTGVPLTMEELEGKFMDLSTAVVSQKQAAKIMDMVYNLDEVKDISSLAQLLRVKT